MIYRAAEWLTTSQSTGRRTVSSSLLKSSSELLHSLEDVEIYLRAHTPFILADFTHLPQRQSLTHC